MARIQDYNNKQVSVTTTIAIQQLKVTLQLVSTFSMEATAMTRCIVRLLV